MPLINADYIINRYNLTPHIEGGYYRQTYKSEGLLLSASLFENQSPDKTHTFCTGIYFLLKNGQYSRLHRIIQDEMWHFYLGDPLRIAMISPQGEYSEVVLGQDITKGQELQFTVPGGYWFGATPCVDSAFSFVGCTVAPGFEFYDFEIAQRDKLYELFPHLKNEIDEFTK